MLKKILLWSLAVSLIAFSCEDDRDLVTLQVGDAPAFTAPAAGLSVDITEENLNETLANFSWSPADYGFAAGINYTLEVDVADNSFLEAIDLSSTTKFDATVSNDQINTIMLTKGLPGGVFTDMEFRVVANAGTQVEELISETLVISVSPVAVAIDYPKLQVPGSYQGWDPANESTVIFSVESDGVYEGYLYVADDGAAHKYTDGPSWDVNWGDTGADGMLDAGGDDIFLGDAGVYRFSANINDLTHSSLRTDWGVIGNATPGGWDNDTDMTYDPGTGMWSVDIDLIADNFIKFRANDGWDVNLGDDNTDAAMEYGGADIPITESGNYTVTLDLTNAVYTYTLTKN
ncbi:MAG: SusE domain-containing protein [Bacteroidota bacterium]